MSEEFLAAVSENLGRILEATRQALVSVESNEEVSTAAAVAEYVQASESVLDLLYDRIANMPATTLSEQTNYLSAIAEHNIKEAVAIQVEYQQGRDDHSIGQY